MSKTTALPILEVKELLAVEDFFQDRMDGAVWKFGVYPTEKTSLEEAGNEAVALLTKLLPSIKKSTNMLCLGGHGLNFGLHLVEEYGCKVEVFCSADDMSEATYKKLEAQKMPEKLTLSRGNLTELPYAWDTFDIVVSLQTMGTTNQKEKILREIASLLKPSGRVLFTLLYRQPFAEEDKIDWSEAMNLISLSNYQRLARNVGLEQVLKRDMTAELLKHQQQLIALLEAEYPAAEKAISKGTAKKYLEWLQLSSNGLDNGNLGWGMVQFQKRNV